MNPHYPYYGKISIALQTYWRGEVSRNLEAPEGQVFVCLACGKQSQDKYGIRKISPGWDESCMLNSSLCHKDKLTYDKDGKVTKVDEGGLVE